MIIYRLNKETGKIDSVTKTEMWEYLRYFFEPNRENKRAVNEVMKRGAVYDSTHYKYSFKKYLLGGGHG